MPRKKAVRHTAEQIIRKLRDADVELAAGKSVGRPSTSRLPTVREEGRRPQLLAVRRYCDGPAGPNVMLALYLVDEVGTTPKGLFTTSVSVRTFAA